MAKPLVLTKEDVLAAMEGRKKMFRELINPQPKTDNSILCTMIDTTCREDRKYCGWNYWAEYEDLQEVGGTRTKYFKPRFQVGDEIYIAEGYQIIEHAQTDMGKWISGTYTADKKIFQKTLTTHEEILYRKRQYPGRPTSGRFMYKSLARTFGRITEVKAEKLQDISRQDAKYEGFWPSEGDGLEHWKGRAYGNAQLAFQACWNSIHGPGAWDLNPWVFGYRWELIRSK